MVLAMEVLEHLEDPKRGLKELARPCHASPYGASSTWRTGNIYRI